MNILKIEIALDFYISINYNSKILGRLRKNPFSTNGSLQSKPRSFLQNTLRRVWNDVGFLCLNLNKIRCGVFMVPYEVQELYKGFGKANMKTWWEQFPTHGCIKDQRGCCHYE